MRLYRIRSNAAFISHNSCFIIDPLHPVLAEYDSRFLRANMDRGVLNPAR